ncbi:MAG: hypothetical protein C4520_13910 [Candidatus Abyssobacteria bacterium SURF_5]|uniref:Glycosyltransferase RgtA/B/C/D-like domain-containing protein n=1 Tax=Abyssobacteria bacterium (strain SURF_5) TaxID=2093360 RepID=A0A3A4NJD1_ABYX5|nr:MAG: hypothetical protein C4520_13910 [Candidatus Abyssubacteria bacterium SURF_5]
MDLEITKYDALPPTGLIQVENQEVSRATQFKTTASILLIILLSFLIFWNKIGSGQFLGDDFIFLEKAGSFTVSAKNLASFGIFHIYHNTLLLASGFRPVPLVLWLALYKLFALESAYYHLSILFLHSAASVLLYLLLRKLFEENVAMITACIFAVFTGHLEAVQWISGFFDVACAFFLLSSLLLFLRFLSSKKSSFYLLSLFSGVLAILSKETAIILPLLLAAVLLWTRPSKDGDLPLKPTVKLVLPFVALFAGYLVARRIFLWDYHTAGNGLLSFLDPRRLLNVWTLLENMTLPHQRTPFIERILPVVVIAFGILSFLAYKNRRESRNTMLFAAAWFFLTAVPTLGFLDRHLYWQRFNYLPSIGFCLLIAEMVAGRPGRSKMLRCVLPGLMIGLYSLNTIHQSGVFWKPAWATARDVQASFREDVDPVLEEPARVYFKNVPELVTGIDVFFTGLPQACAMASRSGKNEFYLESRITPEVPPLVEHADELMIEANGASYYVFEWDHLKKRFVQAGKTLKEPRLEKTPIMWDFSKYSDSSRWEAAQDIHPLSPTGAGSSMFVTTGKDSFFKSPFIGGRSLKYVQVQFSARHADGLPLRGQVFWVTEEDLRYDGRKSVVFDVKNDGMPHTYTVPLYVNVSSLKAEIQRVALRISDRASTVVEMRSAAFHFFE